MKIALVYDRVNKIGGAERILTALHEIWPQAPLYTSVFDSSGAFWAKNWDVRPSILQKIPFASTNHELFAWATPFAFEQFIFDAYDVVVSVTSAEAKTILTKPQTLHICYCLTPTRYLWSGYEAYISESGLGVLGTVGEAGLKTIANTLRTWDSIASARPDYYFSISERVKKRINKYYKRNVHQVIYPPVDIETFGLSQTATKGDYFLVVSRLVAYKRIDLVIDACNALGMPLVVIGQGRDKYRLQQKAGPTVSFIDGYLTDQELVRYYQQCQALLFAGEEDFGLVSVEAQASGTPVIAYKQSGIAESIIDGKTGILFPEQTVASLSAALKRFCSANLDKMLCRKNAARFSKERFKKQFQLSVETVYDEYTKYIKVT